MENKSVLVVKNLSVLIKERFLVKNASFTVERGQCVGIIGEDKAGKTSLIKAIAGALPITDGSVVLDGENIYVGSPALKHINICLDPPVFFKFQTVLNNIQFLSGLSNNNDKEKIIKVLNKFNLAHKIKDKVKTLSFYEKKLMALALAFLTEPKLLILDEPFKGLPDEKIAEIKTYIKEIQAKGTAIIISTRSIEKLKDMSNLFMFMEKRAITKVLTYTQCETLSDKTYAFIAVKYPHYCGKAIMDNFQLKVKLLDNKVLFEADEDTTAEIVRYFSKNNIAIYKAGYLSKQSEKIFGNLAPYYKEEEQT